MHLLHLVFLLLIFPGSARRSTRSDDTYHGAQQHSNRLTDGLAVSAESRQALIPGTGVFRRAGPRVPKTWLQSDSHDPGRGVFHSAGPRVPELGLQSGSHEAREPVDSLGDYGIGSQPQRRATPVMQFGDNNATAEQEPNTYIGNKAFPLLIAFWTGWADVVSFRQYQEFTARLTGQTLRLANTFGSQDLFNTVDLISLIAHYVGGHFLFTCANIKFSRRSCTLTAPVVLGLGLLVDQLRAANPLMRYPPFLLACMQGLVNAAGQQKSGSVTFAFTNHFHKISTDLAKALLKGAGFRRIFKSKSAKLLGAISLGAISSAAVIQCLDALMTNKVLLSKYKFSLIGAVYALILALHELPKKKISAGVSSS